MMSTARDSHTAATPPQRPPPPPGCDIRRNQSGSPVPSNHHHYRRHLPSSMSSPQLLSQSESMRITREQERRHRHEQAVRYGRDRRGSDPRRTSNAQPRGRRIRPEITIVSAQPMAEHPAFADGDKGGYIPPEAPPSYEQAMRDPLPVNPTFTDPAVPDHISQARRVFPQSHIVNSNAVTIPSYTDSILSSQSATVTSSVIVTSSIGCTSVITSVSSSPLLTSQREQSRGIVTRQSAPSPVRRRRNVNSNNSSGSNITRAQRGRNPTHTPQATQSTSRPSPSTTTTDQTVPSPVRQKPALPIKRPVLRPKPRTTTKPGSTTGNPTQNSNVNNCSNKHNGTKTQGLSNSIPSNSNTSNISNGTAPSSSTTQSTPRSTQRTISGNPKLGSSLRNITPTQRTTSPSNPNLLHGTSAAHNASSTVNPTDALDTTKSIVTSRSETVENMSSTHSNQDIMDLFGAQMSGPSQSLPAPLLPNSNNSLNGPQNITSAPSSDFSSFDPFSSQPQGGSISNMPAPLFPSRNMAPQNGALSHGSQLPSNAAVLKPTQLPKQNMAQSAAPKTQNFGNSQNIQPSNAMLQPAKPPAPNLPLGPSVAQPGAILTPMPTPGPQQSTGSSHGVQKPLSPVNSANPLLSPSGNPASRKLPPPPRPSSGPKRAPSVNAPSPPSTIQSSGPNMAPRGPGATSAPVPNQGRSPSPTKPAPPAKPKTLGGASTSPIESTPGGSIASQSLLDFHMPLRGRNVTSQQPMMGVNSVGPPLMDAALTPSSASAAPTGDSRGPASTPQTLDLFSMDPVQSGSQSSGILAPTVNPTFVPRKSTPSTREVPNLSDTGPNPVIEPVYAAVAKKRTVHFTPAEGPPTPTTAGPPKSNAASSGTSLLDMLEPNRSDLVAAELSETPPPPLPASRPPLEDFEDLLSPAEMSHAMAEREKTQKSGSNPPHAAPRHTTPQNMDNLDDLLGFGPMGAKSSATPPREDNPYEFEDILLNGDEKGLPHIAQSTAPPILPAPRNKKKNNTPTSGPPPLPRNQPKVPSGGMVIYNAETPSPEATLVTQPKKADDSEKFTKKLRRKSMKIKRSAMNVFKTQKQGESDLKPPDETAEGGDSPKALHVAKTPTTVQTKQKPARPPGPPPPRPTNLPNTAAPHMQPIQPHLTSPTAAAPAQNLGNTQLISPIDSNPPQVPHAAPRSSPLISPTTTNPTPILNPSPTSKPKPAKPPPPKIIPTRAAPARPPPINNTNQNNHTRDPVSAPQNKTLGIPTPKPRSGSQNDPQNQQQLPPVGKSRPPQRAAPTRPQIKPSRPPPVVPPPKNGARPTPGAAAPPPKPVSTRPQPSPRLPRDGSRVQQSAQTHVNPAPTLGVTKDHGQKAVEKVPKPPRSAHIFTQGAAQVHQKMPESSNRIEVADGPHTGVNSTTPESNLSAIAMYDFNGAADDELVFHAGDKITQLMIVNDDWYKGWLNGKSGIFPSGFVVIETGQSANITDTGTGQGAPDTDSDTTLLPTMKTPAGYPTTWDDAPEILPEGPDTTPTQNNLGDSPEPPSSSPERGDTPSSDKFFDASENFDDALATAVVNSNIVSVEPQLTLVSESTITMTTESSQSNDVPKTTVTVRRTSIALFAFTGQDDSELTFVEGDDIAILGKVNDEWLEGELNGQKGIFPAAYVDQQPQDGASDNEGFSHLTNASENQDFPNPTNKTAAPVGGGFTNSAVSSSGGFEEPMAKGVKDYTAPSSEEVSFKVDDVLYLLEQVDADWLMVQHDGSGAVGNVPMSHVKIIHPLPDGVGGMNWKP